MGAFIPSSLSQEKNLELHMGRGSASPHLNPLSGLANLFARVSPRALPPQRHILWIRWPISMGVRLGRVLPDGPESGHSLASPDSAYVILLPELCHEQQLLSFSQIHR